jgi:hypothetical protein
VIVRQDTLQIIKKTSVETMVKNQIWKTY